jgi:flavorubredoxin
MAEAIDSGIVKQGLKAKVVNAARNDSTHVLTEIFRAAGTLLGSPTYNNGLLHSMAGIAEGIRGMKLKGKLGAAFGSYGWSGEAPQILSDSLAKSGFKVVSDPLKVVNNPTEEELAACAAYGETFAKAVRENL